MGLRPRTAPPRPLGEDRISGRERGGAERSPYAPPPRRTLLVVGFVLLMAQVVLGPLLTFGDAIATGEGNGIRQVGYFLTALLVLVAIRPLASPRRIRAIARPVALALGLCLISVAWSVAPDVSIRRLILTTLVIWTIFALVRNLGYETSLSILRATLVIALVANFVCVLGWPHVGIHQVNDLDDNKLVGDWRGIVKHKNFAGAISAVTVLAFLFDAQRIPRWLRVAAIVGGAVFVFFSQSRTSGGVALASIAIGFIYLGYNARYRGPVLGALALLAAAAAAWVNVFSNPVRVVLSDPHSFTGRSYIWSTLLGYAEDHPWLGAGYGGFWNIGPESPVFEYGKGWVLYLSSGHNGYLDLTVQLGVLGMIAVVALTVGWALVRLVSSTSVSRQQGALLIALLVFSIGHNMTETSLLERDIIVEVILMFTIAMIAQLTGGQSQRRAAPDAPPRPRSRTLRVPLPS